MPRTLPAALTTAMDSGNYNPYIRCIYGEDHDDAVTVQPLNFVIRGLSASVTIPKGENDAALYSTFRLVRGATIDGTVHSISSMYYNTNKVTFNGKFVTLQGDFLPDATYHKVTAGATYEEVITSVTGYNTALLDYEVPANNWKDYQFYPDGADVILNDIRNLPKMLRQKYLIEMVDNGWDTVALKNRLLLFVASEAKAGGVEYTITDPLFIMSNEGVLKRLIWRDETDIVYSQGSAQNPIHNLGFLPGAATPPGNSIQSRTRNSFSSKLAVHLKYQTGDYVTINPSDNGLHEYEGRIEVEEYFSAGTNPAWYNIVRPLQFFSPGGEVDLRQRFPMPGAPGDGAPPFSPNIRDVDPTKGYSWDASEWETARYAPLSTGRFTAALSEYDNNVQEALETLDRHNHDADYAPASEGVTNGNSHDHNGGDGAALTADSIADRTRYIPVTSVWDASAGSLTPLTDAHGSLSQEPHFHLADAATTIIKCTFTIPLPSDYVANAVTINFLWSSSVGGNNVRWQTIVREIADGNTAHTNLVINTSTIAAPGTANTIKKTSVILTTNPSAGKVLSFNVIRLGADAADTNTGQVSLWGIWLEYTADM